MDSEEVTPLEPMVPPAVVAEEDEQITEFRQEKLKYNPFLTRGCCETPRVYHKNDGIFQHRCSKFDAFDWLADVPNVPGQKPFNVVEVRFKNSRKDYFRVPADMELSQGEIIAVEASPGHDIGIVTLAGDIVRFQLQKKGINPETDELKKVYRKARLTDIEKWVGAVESENSTMFRAREIADQLGLAMKINDVEYQGDHTKAIFYYTADDRVDFRELIKLLAEEFKVRIEMRQIGARQEASRLGGIGSCGRELCCATWMGEFRSVTTNAARVQQLSLNPQKLAGQCSKLKCCLNYEYETYLDALKGFPDTEVRLKTQRGEAFHQKSDIFSGVLWYSYVSSPGNFLALKIEKVVEIIAENREGRLPEKLEDYCDKVEKKAEFESGDIQDDLTRFDHL